MGKDFALLFFSFLFPCFCTTVSFCEKKKKNTERKQISGTDIRCYLFRLCVRLKSEWTGGVLGQSDRELAEPGSVFLFLSLSPIWTGFHYRMYRFKTTDCFFLCFVLRWTLERYRLPASQPNLDHTFRPVVCNHPTQPESARSGRLAAAWWERSGVISWPRRKSTTFVQRGFNYTQQVSQRKRNNNTVKRKY